MKKIIVCMMAGMLAVSGCGSNDTNVEANQDNPQVVEVDSTLLSKEVTISNDFLALTGVDTDEKKQEYIEEKKDEFKDVRINDDGSITYVMSKSAYDKALKEMKDAIDESIKDIVESGEYKSIKEVTYNKDLTKFTIVANEEEYKNSFDGLIYFNLGIQSSFYHMFEGKEDEKIHFSFVNEDGVEFDSITLPDDTKE